MDIELQLPNVISATRFLGLHYLQTQATFIILLMTLHRHPELAIIVMFALNIYIDIYEIQIKVNNKSFCILYVALFLNNLI